MKRKKIYIIVDPEMMLCVWYEWNFFREWIMSEKPLQVFYYIFEWLFTGVSLTTVSFCVNEL